MSESPHQPPNDPSKPQSFQHQPVAARVPERVAHGIYSTGQLIQDGPKELIIDFLNGLTRPFHVATRVVMTPQTMLEFIAALERNLDLFTKRFGPPPPLPQIEQPPKPSIQEVYENFKLPDDLLSGHYANAVLIGHGPTEFFFDFITSFYPHSAVSARVLIAASHVPRFLTMLRNSADQYRQRYPFRPPEPPRE